MISLGETLRRRGVHLLLMALAVALALPIALPLELLIQGRPGLLRLVLGDAGRAMARGLRL